MINLRPTTLALFIAGVFTLASPAHGQGFEIGAMGGVACQGREASLCGDFDKAIWSGYASVWPTDRLEAQFRVSGTSLEEFTSEFAVPPMSGPPDSVTSRVFDRSRTLWFGQALYHVGRSRLRPYVGGGAGLVHDRESVSCMPAGCENIPANQRGGFELGTTTDTFGAWNASVGVRALIATSAVVRVGLTFHNFGGGSQATTEFSAGVGWKF